MEVTVNGLLFDLDGTLILSTEPVEKFWHQLAKDEGLDAVEVLKTSHGRRTIDVLNIWKPELADPKTVSQLEATIPERWAEFATPVPGVDRLIPSLPRSQWGIVTSGTYALASGWLKHFLKIEEPSVFITAESVTQGKPDPAGYKMGAEKLGLGKFVVFEDAPAGIKAGKASGAIVVGLATTYDKSIVEAAGADIVIKDMNSVKVKSWNADTKQLTLEIEPVA
uniref:ARAD1D30778p n=1 Tax=Blastobotrys adeninivorans TaxID=409370 RepID=A0A060TBE0_BLAAD